MGMCKHCGKVFSSIEMVDGICKNCMSPDLLQERDMKAQREAEFESNKRVILESVMTTTESFVDLPIEKRIGVVSSECVFGINFIKDIFSFVRDIVGGRIGSIEEALQDAKVKVIEDIKKQAYFKGGDAVIAIKIEHTYNNANAGNILSVFATGTVVKLKHS